MLAKFYDKIIVISEYVKRENAFKGKKTDYRQAFLSVCKIIMFIMHNTFSVTKGLHTCFYYRWCPCCYCYSYPSLQTKSFKGWYQKEGKMWAVVTHKSERRKGETGGSGHGVKEVLYNIHMHGF